MAKQKTATEAEILGEAIRLAFTSPNVCDDNWEAANLVDTTQRVATGLHRIADALEKIALAMNEKE